MNSFINLLSFLFFYLFEVNSALTGMRGTMTALLRRIEILEARPESQGSDGAKCVATKEAKDLPGNTKIEFEIWQRLAAPKIRTSTV